MSSPLTPRLTFSLGLEEMEEEPGLYLGYPSGSPHLCGTPHGFSPCLATLARRKAQPGVPLSESLFLSPYLSLTLCLEEASWRGRMHFSFYFTYLESLSSFTKNQGDQAGMGVGEQGGPSPTSYSLFVFFFSLFFNLLPPLHFQEMEVGRRLGPGKREKARMHRALHEVLWCSLGLLFMFLMWPHVWWGSLLLFDR